MSISLNTKTCPKGILCYPPIECKRSTVRMPSGYVLGGYKLEGTSSLVC